MSWGTLTTWPDLFRTRTLPVQRLGAHDEAHQPPLYYVLAAVAAMWPTGKTRLVLSIQTRTLSGQGRAGTT